MDIAKDIVDKYSEREIIAYLDNLIAGVMQNYRTSIKANQPHLVWSSIGNIDQAKAILHEMRKRNEAVEAQTKTMV